NDEGDRPRRIILRRGSSARGQHRRRSGDECASSDAVHDFALLWSFLFAAVFGPQSPGYCRAFRVIDKPLFFWEPRWIRRSSLGAWEKPVPHLVEPWQRLLERPRSQ